MTSCGFFVCTDIALAFSVEGAMWDCLEGSVQFWGRRFFTCFTNVNQCRYRLVKTLESHDALRQSEIMQNQHFGLFSPFPRIFRVFAAEKI